MVDLSRITSTELQQLLEDHPWFTVARREAIARQGGDEAALRRAVGRDAIFFLSRDEVFRLLTGKVPVAEEPVAARPSARKISSGWNRKVFPSPRRSSAPVRAAWNTPRPWPKRWTPTRRWSAKRWPGSTLNRSFINDP